MDTVEIPHIADDPGVYVITDSDGRILYVGVSQNGYAGRLAQHQTKRWFRQRPEPYGILGDSSLSDGGQRLTWHPCESKDAAQQLERDKISELNPLFNGSADKQDRYVVGCCDECCEVTAIDPCDGLGLCKPCSDSFDPDKC